MKSLHKIGCGRFGWRWGGNQSSPENISHHQHRNCRSVMFINGGNACWIESSRITPFDGDAFLHSRINACAHPVAHHKNVACSAEPHSETGQRLLLFAGFYPNRLVCDVFAKTVCIIYPRAASAVTLSKRNHCAVPQERFAHWLADLQAMQAH